MGISFRGRCEDCRLRGQCGRTVGDITGGCSSGYLPAGRDTGFLLSLTEEKARMVWSLIRDLPGACAEDAVIAALESVCRSNGTYPITADDYMRLITAVKA